MRIHGDDDTKELWAPISNEKDHIQIDLRTPIVADGASAQVATQLPKNVPEAAISDFITEFDLDRHATYANVQRLVDALRERIAYEDVSYSSTIGDTLARKTGDCTEFADVFDAVSMQLGWHSRIRTGLAYHSPTRSFRPHSWNEVAIDGRWISADASWGQVPADASHVPFPRGNTLALLAKASSMWFEVVDQQY